MGLYQYYNCGMGRDVDHTLTIEDVTQGDDASDAAIFADALKAQPDVSHARHLPRSVGNSDIDEMFAEEVPTQPYMGHRSQWE
jgi:hypothetical protein